MKAMKIADCLICCQPVCPLQVVLNLSESQVQDLLFIRRLNLTKRCVLSAERTALMQRMAASEAEALDNRCDHLQTVSLLTAQLQQNTAEDRQVYYKLAKALYRGVSTLTCLLTLIAVRQPNLPLQRWKYCGCIDWTPARWHRRTTKMS